MAKEILAWGYCDFDRMEYVCPIGAKYELEIEDGVVYAKHNGRLYFFVSGTTAQKDYQEYVSKKIEQELLRED